jgi:hypothetical protein
MKAPSGLHCPACGKRKLITGHAPDARRRPSAEGMQPVRLSVLDSRDHRQDQEMTDGFLPEFKLMPAKGGGYRCTYRLFDGKPFVLIPGEAKSTAAQALNAAKAYVRAKLNPPIRREIAVKDVLGIAQWHEQRQRARQSSRSRRSAPSSSRVGRSRSSGGSGHNGKAEEAQPA